MVAADSEATREALEDALDDMCDDGELFLGKYELYSSMTEARPGGGQGIVQFARWPAANRDVAIKVRPLALKLTEVQRISICQSLDSLRHWCRLTTSLCGGALQRQSHWCEVHRAHLL